MVGFNSFWQDIIVLIGCSGLFIFMAFCIGKLFCNPISDNIFRTSFYQLIIGTFVIINFFSFYYAGIKTVNVISMGIIFYLAFQFPPNFIWKWVEFKPLLYFIYILPFIFGLYALYKYPSSINHDFKFYSKIVAALSQNGQENFYHFYNTYDNAFNGILPYHYTEFWLASLFNVSTGSLATFSLRYFSYPLFLSITVFGVFGISKGMRWLQVLIFLICSLLLIGQYLMQIDVGWEVITDFWRRPNFIIYYLIFMMLYLAIMDANWILFYAFISIAFTLSFIIVPSTMMAIIALNIYLLYYKQVDYKLALKYLSVPVISFIALLLFYKWFGSAINVSTKFDLKAVLAYNLVIWKAIVMTTAILLLQVLAIPVLSYFLSIKKNGHTRIAVFSFFVSSIVFSGILLFQTLTQIDNAYQFPYFAYAGVGFIFFIWVLKLFDFVSYWIFKFALPVVLLLLVYNNPNFKAIDWNRTHYSLSEANLITERISPAISNQFKDYLALHPKANGASLFSSDFKSAFEPKGRQCLTKQIGSGIAFLTDRSNLPSIAAKDSLLVDMTTKRIKDYEKLSTWISVFPNFTNRDNPKSYLLDGTFDYFICHRNFKVSDPNLNVIRDSLCDIQIVYRIK